MDEAGAGVEPIQKFGAGRLDRRFIQIEARGHGMRRLNQLRQPGIVRRETPDGIGLVGGQAQFVLPRRTESGFIGFDFRDHRGELFRRARRQAPNRDVRPFVAAQVRQQSVRGADAGRRLDQQRRQQIRFAGLHAEIIVVAVARQHDHLRRRRPRGRRMAQKRRDGLRRAHAVRQQIAGVLENRHAGAQALGIAEIRERLGGGRQIARGDHQVIDRIGGGHEPRIGRGGFRRQRHHGSRFRHGALNVARSHGPRLGRQRAGFVGNPSRISRGIQDHGHRFRERRGGNRRQAGDLALQRARGRRHGARKRSLDPIHDEEALAAAILQDAFHRQRVFAVFHGGSGNRQFSFGDVLVVERQFADRGAVEGEPGQVVGIVGRTRPPHQADLQMHVAAGMAGQVERERLHRHRSANPLTTPAQK